jgi:serine/threonine-protein kinase
VSGSHGLFRRAAELCAELRELAPPQQECRLAAACAGDVELLALARTLLAGDRTPLTGFDRPAIEHVRVPELALPERIGRCRILRVIGRGGQGIVYEAEQDVPRRPVAVKVIGTAWIGVSSRRRFEEEVEILGRLEHPSIARIYEGGVAPGPFGDQPYFVMELVLGKPLTEHANEHGLDLAARVRLLTQICKAVEHAHGKLVVHCDLKPANILVTAERGGDDPRVGRPLILDFGIAQVLGRAEVELAAGKGTPGFMAPEQEAGEHPHVRWDVFALGKIGALLVPSAVARRDRHHRDGFDAIFGKATERDPDRRYRSVEEFRKDLERCLRFEPPEGVPTSWARRAALFARRHRTAVAPLGLVLAVASFAAWAGVRAERAETRALAERERKASLGKFLDEVMKLIDPEVARGREFTPKEVLERSEETARRDFTADPEVHARILQKLGAKYLEWGLLAQAERTLVPAREALVRELGPDDRDTLEATICVGELRIHQGRYGEADELLRATDEHCLARFGALDPLTLDAEHMLGCNHIFTGDWSAADRHLTAVLAGRERVLGPMHRAVLVTRSMLGALRAQQQRWTEAEALLNGVIEDMRSTGGEDDPRTLVTLSNLAALYAAQHDYNRALDIAWSNLEASERILGPEHPGVLVSRANLGSILGGAGQTAEAEAFLRELVQDCERVLAPGHPLLFDAHQSLARILGLRGKLDEAEAEARFALSGQRESLGAGHPTALSTLEYLAQVLIQQGRIEEGIRTKREGLELVASNPQLSAIRSARWWNDIAQALARLGRQEEARAAAEQALACEIAPVAAEQRARSRSILDGLAAR